MSDVVNICSVPRATETLEGLASQFPTNLKLAHVNAQSLLVPSHITEFQLLFEQSTLDIVAVSETFFNCPADAPKLSSYNVFTANRTSHQGGGVAVYVRNNIKVQVLAFSVSPEHRVQKPDFIILELALKEHKVLFACVYRPPKAGYFEEFEEEFFSHILEFKYAIVTGDVNAHFGSTRQCDINDSKAVLRMLDLCNLTRIEFGPTFHIANCDSNLDMIAVSSADEVIHFDQSPVRGLSAHDMLLAVFSFRPPKFKPQIVTRRSYAKFDLNCFRSDVASVPWHDMFNLTDINEKIVFFNEHLLALYDKHAPFRTFKLKHEPKPWITEDILHLMKSRDNAYAKSRLTKLPGDLQKFKFLRNQVTKEIRDAKIRYSTHLFMDCNNPKELWSNLKKLNVRPNTTETVNSSGPSAEELNKFYTEAPIIDEQAIRDNIDFYNAQEVSKDEKFHFKDISFDDLAEAVLSVKSNAQGVDCISLSMIKRCIVELGPAILNIFNFALQNGCFPELWKTANVKPIPKKTNAAIAKDFRPISLLCALGKVLEKIVHKQISMYLCTNNLLNPLQSGFKPGHSTETSLLKVVGDIREAMERRELTMLILYDFSNAFPSVHHELLLAKLRLFGFSQSALSWVRAYLTNRKQQVVNGEDISSLINLLLGVPQGSVLGPLLFSLYINDIYKVLQASKHHLYADDFQKYLHFRPENFVTAVNTVNDEAVNLVNYGTGHNLQINASKTQVIIVGNPKIAQNLPLLLPPVVVNGIELPYLKEVKNLGVLMDQHLTWEAQAISVCKKAMGALCSIRKHRDMLPITTRTRLVQALVLPTLYYGNIVTSDMADVYSIKIQRLQNASIRFIFDLRRDCHITPFYEKLGWLKIKNRHKLSSLLLLKKVITTNLPLYLSERIIPVSHTVATRLNRSGKPMLLVPQHRTDTHRGAFWISAVILWNKLPPSCHKATSTNSFKNRVFSYLLSLQHGL